jgi:hypothetical protein
MRPIRTVAAAPQQSLVSNFDHPEFHSLHGLG